MSKYQPPFTLTNKILILVANISEAIGRLTARIEIDNELRLRRVNRMRTSRGLLPSSELQRLLGLKDKKSFNERYLQPALRAGVIEMETPDKPSRRLQKYQPRQRQLIKRKSNHSNGSYALIGYRSGTRCVGNVLLHCPNKLYPYSDYPYDKWRISHVFYLALSAVLLF